MDRIATPPSSSKKSRGLQILQEMGVETPATKKSKNLSSNQTSPPTAAADAGLKSRSPGGRVLQIEHSHLLKVLENLLLAYRIRPKGQMLSFAGAKQALSKMNVRFDIKHLAQIIHLCPELSWKNVQSSRDSTPRERLMIVIASLDNSTVTTDDAFIVNGLKKQLLDICDRCKDGEIPTIPEAELPDPASSIVSTPTASSKKSSGSRSVVSPYIVSPASVGGKMRTSTPKAVRDKLGRRSAIISPNPAYQCSNTGLGHLSPVVESEEGTSKQTFTKDSLAPTDKTETIETPNRQRRQSVNWDESILEASDQQIDLGLGSLSAASKQVIRETQQVRELMSPQQVGGRKKGHALAILTETFDLVRAIFHRHKATVMNLELVLEKMKQSQGGKKGPKDDALRFNLLQLLEHSSPYLKLDTTGAHRRPVLVVDHSADLKQIRDQLKLVSSTRFSCEIGFDQEHGGKD